MLYRLKSPCKKCPQKDRSSYSCLKCEARSMYADACEGSEKAIAYLKDLDYSTLGLSKVDPSKNWRKTNTKDQAWYEKEYEHVYAAKRLQYPGPSKFGTFRGMVQYLYKINITLKATAKDFGVTSNTLVHILESFSIPQRDKKETFKLLQKKKSEGKDEG